MNGRVAQTINPLGITNAFGYDAQGRRRRFFGTESTLIETLVSRIR